MNLTTKFILSILVITGLWTFTFAFLQIDKQKEMLRNELNQRIELIRSNLEENAKRTIRVLKQNVENDIAAFNFSHINETFNQLLHEDQIGAVMLLNIDSTKQIFSGKSSLKEYLPKEHISQLSIKEINTKKYFIISMPITLSDKWGEIHIVYSLEKLNQEISEAEENIKNKIDSNFIEAIYTSMILACSLALLSYFFTRRLISPIILLTHIVEEITDGNHDVTKKLTSIKTNDEIGILANTFKAMSKRLYGIYKDLVSANNELQQKTIELQELNASLEQKVAQKVAKITEQEELMIAQSRLAVMGEMMSMIAHQWRQPLSTTTLLISNEKIKLMLAGQEDNKCVKMLDTISDTMVYLSDTIDDFQTYFKPGKDTEEILLSELIHRTKQFIKPRLDVTCVKLNIQNPDQARIWTYVNEVVQVIINILNNAIDVLVEKISSQREIWIKIDNGDENVTICIEDNGGGIEKDIMNKVFEPYFSTKSKNGTGLGLYMAKMIVEKHIGGRLNVHNTQRGACFTIELPKTPLLQK